MSKMYSNFFFCFAIVAVRTVFLCCWFVHFVYGLLCASFQNEKSWPPPHTHTQQHRYAHHLLFVSLFVCALRLKNVQKNENIMQTKHTCHNLQNIKYVQRETTHPPFYSLRIIFFYFRWKNWRNIFLHTNFRFSAGISIKTHSPNLKWIELGKKINMWKKGLGFCTPPTSPPTPSRFSSRAL